MLIQFNFNLGKFNFLSVSTIKQFISFIFYHKNYFIFNYCIFFYIK